MKRTIPRLLLGIFVLIHIFLQVSSAQEIPPSPIRWVTDKAGFLSSETVADLNQRLETFEHTTGHQVIVYIDRSTQGVPIEEWSVSAFEAWGIGKKRNDDGLALFIMTDDRKLRIEVGYGLEHIVPDAAASRIIDEILVPSLRNESQDEGVRRAVARLMEIITGKAEPEAFPTEAGRRREKVPVGTLILFGIAGLFFLFLLITNPRLALHLLFIIMSSGGGRSGGRSGGGGIFRGGGGRSGGGGASGSW